MSYHNVFYVKPGSKSIVELLFLLVLRGSKSKIRIARDCFLLRYMLLNKINQEAFMATSPKPDTPVTTVSAKILSITIDSKITACLGDTPIKLPNWEQGTAQKDGPCSAKPGVFEIDNGNNRNKLKVGLNVTGLTGETEGTLTGTFEDPDIGEIIFEGTIEGGTDSTAVRVIDVFPREEPTYFKRIQGNMKWTFSFKNTQGWQVSTDLGETPVEIFWIYGYPGRMYKKGVWIEALRFLYRECYGLKKKEWIILRIVNYCHSGFGLRYNSYLSCPSYGVTYYGGVFDLKAYLARAYPFCNCFDQAGALQTLLGALGIQAHWVQMSPFGYLKNTSLVGRGLINNTDFLGIIRDTGDKITNISELIPRNDPNRGGFGQHAFCIWNDGKYDNVLDACVGPHVGIFYPQLYEEGHKQHYISESIDGMTDLYSQGNHFTTPGRLNYMNTNYAGVIGVHGVTAAPDMYTGNYNSEIQRKIINGLKSEIGFDEIDIDKFLGQGVVFDWKDFPFQLEEIKNNLPKGIRVFENLLCEEGTALREWSFNGLNEYLKIEIYVSNDIKPAKNRLLMFALSNTMTYTPVKKKKSHIGDGDKNGWTAPGDETQSEIHKTGFYWHSPYYKIEQWWFFNIYVSLEAYNMPIEMNALTDNIEALIEKRDANNRYLYVKNPLWEHLPFIKSAGFSFKYNGANPEPDVIDEIRVGDEVEIIVEPVNPADPLILEFFITQWKCLRLVEENPPPGEGNGHTSHPPGQFVLEFEARAPGATEIRLVLVNTRTLLCSPPKLLTINVVDETNSEENKK